nr:gamma-glutamyltransferase family protein [bacterium]
MDLLRYPYPSRRAAVLGKHGMVASSHPAASAAGLWALQQGGNACDAAVAMAAALAVVEPGSNGIGGDGFALIWHNGRLHGLNASGPAPRLANAEQLRSQGHTAMPVYGWPSVTVPGAPAGWAAIAHRFGRLDLPVLFRPAIDLARDGFAVYTAASTWAEAGEKYRANLPPELFASFAQLFQVEGRWPRPGDILRFPDTADTLETLAATGCRDLYEGRLAGKIDAFSRKTGGWLRAEDLAAYKPQWVEPIGVDYRGYRVWEIPPNGQGMVALMALNILKNFSFDEDAFGSSRTVHLQLEAMKLAFADGLAHIADPSRMRVGVQDLLSDAFARERAARIGARAAQPTAATPPKGGTVYFAAADGEGNMVSIIQSQYQGFGSGVVVPGTGIHLQNRGCNFSLQKGAVGELTPGVRPYHTIIPGFLTRGNQAVGPFGVMGAFMQPQGHVQVVMNMVDFGMNPQAALDAPRWCFEQGLSVAMEPQFPLDTPLALEGMGHAIHLPLRHTMFGRGQVIWRMPNGALVGGTESRADGALYAY